jgi:HemY protein
MLIHQADRLIEQGYRPAALEKLRAAHKVDPGFPPLAQRLAQFYIDRNKRRRAIRVLEKAWKRFPHPDLVPLWDEVAPRNKPNDSQVRLRWFERLLSLRPDSAEGQMAVARAAIDDGLWGEARAYLAQAEKIRPNPRLYRMWAELEDLATHDEDAARTWLEKAAQAPGDKAWVCTRTGRIYEQWAPIAAPHGSFNTITWDYPESWRRGDSGEDTNAIAHDELYMLT